MEMNSLDPGISLEMKAKIKNWRENHFGQLVFCEHIRVLIAFNTFSLINLFSHYVCSIIICLVL